ncbi:MAG: response regulator [bacterium]
MDSNGKMKKTLILVVDDITENLQLIGNVLVEEGYEISMANSGTQALRMIDKISPDLILLDIMMPDINGFEVCGKIKQMENKKNIPIIFLTAQTDTTDVVRGFELGGVDYIIKPFKREELLVRINTHLELKLARETIEKQVRDLEISEANLMELNQKLDEKVRQRTAELIKANESLKELDKAKNYFISLLSHELNTPLSGIHGFTQILKSELVNEEHIENCNLILNSVKRLKKFAEISKLITELQTKTYHLNIEEHILKDVILSMLSGFDNIINEKQMEIDININPVSLTLKFDEYLINKVIEIVIDNSIKFSKANSKIQIKGEEEGTFYKLRFIDEGPGFKQDLLKSVFEMFQSDEIMHHSEGFGLGLSTAKLIMDIHHGYIKAENGSNGGAIVALYFEK